MGRPGALMEAERGWVHTWMDSDFPWTMTWVHPGLRCSIGDTAKVPLIQTSKSQTPWCHKGAQSSPNFGFSEEGCSTLKKSLDKYHKISDSSGPERVGDLPNITQQDRDQISQQVQEALPRVKASSPERGVTLSAPEKQEKEQKRTKAVRGREDLRGKEEEEGASLGEGERSSLGQSAWKTGDENQLGTGGAHL